jgi:acetoacetyl-CoA synthetase
VEVRNECFLHSAVWLKGVILNSPEQSQKTHRVNRVAQLPTVRSLTIDQAGVNLPKRIKVSQMTAFTDALQTSSGEVFADYEALHAFSVRSYRTFWKFFLCSPYGLANWSGELEPVCVGDDCENARFFPKVRLNYADNLLDLSVASGSAPALTACYADGRRVRWTRGQLRLRVARLAQAMSVLGVRAGDRVVGVMRNDAEAITAALATSALGATLSTVSPEMGFDAMLERFSPLAPRLLFAHTASQPFDLGVPLGETIAALAAALASLSAVVALDGPGPIGRVAQPVHTLVELTEQADATAFSWEQFAFNHPLFIMFSSGTTGMPKCIVHGAGGSLLEHLKEHRLHTDLRPGERLYFHTSCAWMMWNWQMSALASGVEIVTYDGPVSTIEKLWKLIADERVTVFGTSPAYLKMCQDKELIPGRSFDLGALRTILSTGSVLFDTQFTWVRDAVKQVPLQSISGGTDILGCFVLGNPNLPIVDGEAQCKSLGLDVQSWKDGAPTRGIGQLVCVSPFPSCPLGFFNDPDGARFHAAYFAMNRGCWTHGDLIEFSAVGTARLHGRSDGVLNVRGINVGPGEIYRILNDIEAIREAMVVEQRGDACAPGEGAVASPSHRLLLLVVLHDGFTLNAALVSRVRRELASRASAAHVPDRIFSVEALPLTHSGKLSESAVRSAVNGLAVPNLTALRNPECLEAIYRCVAICKERPEIQLVDPSLEALEQCLQACWEAAFGFAPIDRQDNFFSLGGNSILAIQLLSDLQLALGRVIPFSALFSAPTIAGLARLLYLDGTTTPPKRVVLVRPGVGTPVFLVPGLSGTAMEFWAMVASLQTERPVYGLEADGLDGEAAIYRSVEEMAATYIEEIRRLQISGPFSLIGYSFGGLLALEIAQQLVRAGEQIGLLYVLDTYVTTEFLPWNARLKYRLYRARRSIRQQPARHVPAFILGIIASKSVNLCRSLKTKLGLKSLPSTPSSSSPQSSQDYAELPLAMRQVRLQLSAAQAAYRPVPYSGGPIFYVRSKVLLEEYGDPITLWQRIASAGLVVTEVAAAHLAMMTGRDVLAIAALVDQALQPS